ncbi:uncharacterized protein LOC131244236 [Magnolia sinica]|uniref:uncharacterized protein LOC131244236 n=1 Tax=Magnolia sinica TaxID=86752 RepID=UPI0026585055|nr:uncharacterized protein LOC131244236 [Magnolia sinica]
MSVGFCTVREFSLDEFLAITAIKWWKFNIYAVRLRFKRKGKTRSENKYQLYKSSSPPMGRRNWEISRRDLRNPQFIAVVATDHDFMDADYNEYSSQSARSMICCHSVAVIFMVLLVLRHMLPITVSRAEECSFTIFVLLWLRTVGILVPVYIMTRALTAIHHRLQQQVALFFQTYKQDLDQQSDS